MGSGVPASGRAVRPRRSGQGRRGRPSRLVVAVTWAASPAGRAVTAALRDAPGVSRVVAVDTRRGPVDGITWRLADPASPTVADALRDADAVVHVAAPDDLAAAVGEDPLTRRERVVRSAQAVVTAAAAVGAAHVVVVTSAMVYGAVPGGPVPVPENAELSDVPDDGLVGDVLEVEAVAARAVAAHPGLVVSQVRPAALVGPGVDTVVTRHFEAPRLLTLRESPMLWQFCHVDDLGTAVAAVVAERLGGPVTVGAAGALNQAAVEQISGMRRIDLPTGLAFSTAERLHRVSVLPMPANDLSYVVYPWVVSSAAVRAVGWNPVHDNETCLQQLLTEVSGKRALAARRVGSRDAALGAAGAAVAVMGTAAVWRQAQSRRRRSGR